MYIFFHNFCAKHSYRDLLYEYIYVGETDHQTVVKFYVRMYVSCCKGFKQISLLIVIVRHDYFIRVFYTT